MTSDGGKGPLGEARAVAQDVPRPRVVMLVANDVSVDARVQKSATTVASTSAEVTVLGISPSGKREHGSIGEAELVLLPVSVVLRNRPATRRSWRWLASDHDLKQEIRAERESFSGLQREIGARIGWLRRDYFENRSARALRVNERQLGSNSLQVSGDKRTAPRNAWTAQRLNSYLHLQAGRVRQRLHRSTQRRLDARFRRTERRLDRKLKRLHGRTNSRIAKLKKVLVNGDLIMRRPNWRWALPELHDLENSFGPELDDLDPDIIHVHDVHLLGIAVRAAGRSYIRGRVPKIIYDAHEYISGLGTYRRPTVAAFATLEADFIDRVDRIITVSEPLADLLKRDYQLPTKPDVVMNTPTVGHLSSQSLREISGVSESDILAVYSGGLDPRRGVHTLVEAVGRLQHVHLALVSNSQSDYAGRLQNIAERGGFADRLHFVPFVPSDQVAAFLKSATIGVSPISSVPLNHRVTLTNKVFEYMHARLPVVVSDCPATADLVRDHGIGEVFASGDTDDLTRTIDHVLRNLATYHASYDRQPELLDRYSWEAQRENLLRIYGEILGDGSLSKRRDELGVPPPTAKGY
jgi:glycosyltransferase involved in cell wall biosynthesis